MLGIIDTGKRAGALTQARAGTLLVATGEVLYAAMDQDATLVRLRLAHAALCFSLAIFLTARRASLSVPAFAALTLFMLVPLLPIMWLGESTSALSGRSRDPFVGHHLVLLGTAVFMPGALGLAWMVLGVFTASAILNYCNLAHRVDIPMEEPLVTALHFAVAAAILAFRERIQRLRELYEEARAAAQALIELGKIARAMRDGVSSPLQTIAAATFLLRRRLAGDDFMLDRIDRAVDRIHRLVETLDMYEPQWNELEQSFDARAELGEQYEGLNKAARRGQRIAR